MTKHVLVTTEFRGVFFGEQIKYDEEKRSIVLDNARCAIRWNTGGGFLELAEKGPNSGSKIGSVAPTIMLNGVTSIAVCTSEAVEKWNSL